MMHNSFCDGTIVHHRFYPKVHHFKYNMSWCLLDVSQLQQQMDQSRFWSLDRFNIISIRQKDYVNSSKQSIEAKIRKYIKSKINRVFNGKIFLFTHPRYLGFGFNSVNFYFCYDKDTLKFIISEINNTPWKQKHLYFHAVDDDLTDQSCNSKTEQSGHFEFKKEFHISPFVEMNIDYSWIFKISSKKLEVQMVLKKQQQTVMKVFLHTKFSAMNGNKISLWLLSKPFQSLKMFFGIYWQATKIWLKKIPFYNHPEKSP